MTNEPTVGLWLPNRWGLYESLEELAYIDYFPEEDKLKYRCTIRGDDQSKWFDDFYEALSWGNAICAGDNTSRSFTTGSNYPSLNVKYGPLMMGDASIPTQMFSSQEQEAER